MLTAFGKELRKHRIDKEITLREMAEGLNVSPAFLSCVETGKRSIPEGMVDSLARLLDLPSSESLTIAAQQSTNVFKINLHGNASEGIRKLVSEFVRRIPDLEISNDQADEFICVLDSLESGAKQDS